jgi:hypothetical protein
MRKVLLICLLFIQILSSLQAQEKVTILGKVTDKVGAPLAQATVYLIAGTDSFRCLTKPNGHFSIAIPSIHHFGVIVTIEGFLPFQKNYILPDDSISITLPPIALAANYGALVPVTVIAVRPIRIREDTVEFFADAFKIRAGDELEYLLKRFPGLEITADGSVIYQGKKVMKLKLNGRDYIGADIPTTIHNLPADIIESIQLIDDYGDKERLLGIKAGEGEKALNIVLKQDKRNGELGRIELGIGNKKKLIGGQTFNAIKGDRQLTFNTWVKDTAPTKQYIESGVHGSFSNTWNKQWSFSSAFSVWKNSFAYGDSTIQDSYLPGSQIHSQEGRKISGNDVNNGIGFQLEYRPQHGTLIRLSPSFRQATGFQTDNTNMYVNESDGGYTKITNTTTIQTINSRSTTTGASLYAEKIAGASGIRLTVLTNIQYFNQKQQTNLIQNNFISVDTLVNSTGNDYLLSSANRMFQITTTANCYLPLRQSSFLDLGLSINHASYTNENLSRAKDVIVDSLSNNYMLTLSATSFHIGYITQFTKFSLNTGLDAQPAAQRSGIVEKANTYNYSYFNLLPMVQISWYISSLNKMSLEYQTKSQPVSIQQLQPLTNLTNPQYPTEGNPLLKPSFVHTFRLNYVKSTSLPSKYPSLAFNINYKTTENIVVTAITHPHDTTEVIQKTTFSNVNGAHELRSGYLLTLPSFFKNKFSFAISGNLTMNRIITLLDGHSYKANTLGWSQGLRLNMFYSNVAEYQLSANYGQTRASYPASSSPSSLLAFAYWTIQSRHIINTSWLLNYSISQYLMSTGNGSWKTNRSIIAATIEKQFLMNNRFSIKLSLYNILNSNTGVSQVITPTSLTQTRMDLTGRFFLLGFVWKFEKFRKTQVLNTSQN